MKLATRPAWPRWWGKYACACAVGQFWVSDFLSDNTPLPTHTPTLQVTFPESVTFWPRLGCSTPALMHRIHHSAGGAVISHHGHCALCPLLEAVRKMIGWLEVLWSWTLGFLRWDFLSLSVCKRLKRLSSLSFSLSLLTLSLFLSFFFTFLPSLYPAVSLLLFNFSVFVCLFT